jgi:hypothetical protein
MTKFAISALLVLAACLTAHAQPPPGPRDRANCPVTGKPIVITADTPAVAFHNGQRLFFADAAAARAYSDSPRDYWLAPHEMPLKGVDGKRGLPDFRNETMRCPSSNETMVISMRTPRVVHQGGQNVYFCCFGCVMGFWTDPTSMILGPTN